MSALFGETIIRQATLADADTVSCLHGEAFGRGWSFSEVESLLVRDNINCLIAERRRGFGRKKAAGFVMIRNAGEEAEVLSIAVGASFRRRGFGRALMEEALRALYRDRVLELYLEVDGQNSAAVNLYRSLEFAPAGERPGYYRQGVATPRTALVMSRQVR